MNINLIGPAYQEPRLSVLADLMINLFPIVSEKNVTALYPTPGLELWASVGTGPIRGQIVAGGYLWAVSGTSLYRLTTAGASTLVGTVLGSGAVAMAENGTQIMIGCGASRGYVVTMATPAVAQITDPDFVGADWVAFLDGYFLFGLSSSAQFYGTALYDATNIDALDFASAEGSPGNIVTGIVDHRELMLFKAGSMEGHRNTGAAGFPIERIEGAFMEHGCAARLSVVKIDNSVFFLGQDDKGAGMVWRIEGYSPTRISTHGIEYAIRKWPTLSDAYGWAFQQDGRTFYVISSPSGSQTFVYDCSTQMWHEWAYWDAAAGLFSRHRGANHSFFGGNHIVGDHTDGKLYRLSLDVGTDNDATIRRIRRFTIPRVGNKSIDLGELEIICESGIGLTTGQGEDPQLMLRISRDDGHTWSNQLWRSMGKVGEYGRRVLFTRTGSSLPGRSLVIEIEVTDPVPMAFISAYAEPTAE